MYATTLSDSKSSKSDSDESCDGEGNFSTFITIAHVESLGDLSVLVEELGEHIELELIGIVEESDDEEDEGTVDCKRPIIPSLRRLANMQKWLRKPLKR